MNRDKTRADKTYAHVEIKVMSRRAYSRLCIEINILFLGQKNYKELS